MENVLIIGATSAMAQATARLYAGRGANLYLLARDGGRLGTVASDLKIRGAASVGCRTFDAATMETHSEDIQAAFEALGNVDVALVAHGTLPDQRVCEKDFYRALKELRTNAVGTLSVLTHLANGFESQGRGVLAVITSVAGDRGRQSNYVYGSAKSMVSTFLQGLRGRLHRSGVHVIDIKPGFVDTPMTAGFQKGILWVKPETVARVILHSVGKQKNTVYVPWFWGIIMFVIRNIPENIFKKMRL